MRRKKNMTIIRLTKHVRERRKKGYIPDETLFKVARYLITSHDLKNRKDGIYKFAKRGVAAVISKKNQEFIFVTFFGATGYVLDTEDYGEFRCIYQSEEYLVAKKARLEKRKLVSSKRCVSQKNKSNETLQLLNKDLVGKLKKGNFIIEELNDNIKEVLYSKYKCRGIHYIFRSKFDNYQFVEILKKNGLPCFTLTKSKFDSIIKCIEEVVQ